LSTSPIQGKTVALNWWGGQSETPFTGP